MYADLGEYQECVRIWNYALGLKIMKETLLSLDTGLSLRSLVQLYLDLALRQAELGGQAGDNILHKDRKIEKLSKVLHFKCLASYFLSNFLLKMLIFLENASHNIEPGARTPRSGSVTSSPQ